MMNQRQSPEKQQDPRNKGTCYISQTTEFWVQARGSASIHKVENNPETGPIRFNPQQVCVNTHTHTHTQRKKVEEKEDTCSLTVSPQICMRKEHRENDELSRKERLLDSAVTK